VRITFLKQSRAKKYSLVLFDERKHSEKIWIITLIFQSEEVSHFNSFARHEFHTKSTLKLYN